MLREGRRRNSEHDVPDDSPKALAASRTHSRIQSRERIATFAGIISEPGAAALQSQAPGQRHRLLKIPLVGDDYQWTEQAEQMFHACRHVRLTFSSAQFDQAVIKRPKLVAGMRMSECGG